MVYTSETVQGQIYIPAANWTRAFDDLSIYTIQSDISFTLVAILTIVVVAAFKNLTSLTNAYGYETFMASDQHRFHSQFCQQDLLSLPCFSSLRQ